MIANVILPAPIPKLSYGVPKHLEGKLSVGDAVTVPLRKKETFGYIAEFMDEKKDMEVKNIIASNEGRPSLDEEFLSFLQWVAQYYHYPVGEVLRMVLVDPKIKKKKIYSLGSRQPSDKELELFSKRSGKRLALLNYLKEEGSVGAIPKLYKNVFSPLKKEGFICETLVEEEPQFLSQESFFPTKATLPRLNKEQRVAYDTVSAAITKSQYQGFLLHGITGSGKTEVYLSAAKYALGKGKSVLILVPEISLTPQLLARARAHLGNNIAVIHSSLTKRERNQQWELIYTGKAKIALGVRSTIFAPMANIGLIIVDEEHESSFKQEDRLRYNARDMALVRGKRSKAVVILGSATPSLESYYHCLNGKLEKLSLKNRPNHCTPPDMEIINLRKEKGLFSNRLIKKIEETLERKKQIILFLNRRGSASFLLCDSCGHVPECKHCSVSLIYYERKNKLSCHYCGYTEPRMRKCGQCDHSPLSGGTPGTEFVEKELKTFFPNARILRMDRETTSNKGALEKNLSAISNQECDIIVGTQMIAKGHDYPNIELVASINSDTALKIPDFRANETCFQLLTQVAGRAGRGKHKGFVLLQTYNPTHPSIRHTKNYAYEDFAREELEKRLEFHYPPYFRIALIIVSSKIESHTQKTAQKIYAQLQGAVDKTVELLGPTPAAIQKVQNKYRWNILIKAKDASKINRLLGDGLPHWRKLCHRSTRISVDVDPVSLL